LEVRQHYDADIDQARFAAFAAGRPLPPPGADKLADLSLIRRLCSTGRTIGRVHVVDRPLSSYICFEMAAYAENVAAGEQVRIADRSVCPELGALTEDFALFDHERPHASVVLFDYGEDDRVHGYAHTTRDVTRRIEQLRLALACSTSLEEFIRAEKVAQPS
jgi:hypothetical protein